MLELIAKKQRGEELTGGEIARLISRYTTGAVPDYQMAALLMAVFFQGLSERETVHLTRALLNSGERWELPAEFRPVLDKHSTGGVGDKTSLLLVPMLAAAGFKVPKLSGRGLAHTGGTIDKLESIPGFGAELSRAQALAQLGSVGCVIMSQSEGLVPAEKKLYALRDATGTVAQQGLIISSILSKKLAAGATHIVIDVKFGRGAFFPRESAACEFAQALVRTGREFEPAVAAAVTSMEQPLGRAVGNALEVAEVLDLLAGRDTASEVSRLCLTLGGILLKLAGCADSTAEGEERLAATILSGAAENRFRSLIAAQGGDLDAFARQLERLEEKAERIEVKAPTSGHLAEVDALAIGRFCHRQGAGRERMDETINPWVGVVLHRKRGEEVEAGEVLAEAYVRPGSNSAAASTELLQAFAIGAKPPPQPLVSTVIYG